MTNKIWNKAVSSALTTAIGLSSLMVISSASAENNQKETILPNSNEQTIATNSQDSIQEFLFSKLYQHQLDNKQAVTLQFYSTPIVTFLGSSEKDIIFKANELASRLEELYQQQIDATLITVSWNDKSKDYTIKFKGEELVTINQNTILPDTTNNLELDALQATNRLRRLLGNVYPLTEVEGKPQPKPQTTVKTPNRNNQVATAQVKSIRKGYQGIASWYGPGFHGRKTASGERFNQNALTAAHRYLPFGTQVKVTNLRNGNSVVVRINDRGPFTGGRIIDLSAGAARLIGVKSSGIAPVSLQVLGF